MRSARDQRAAKARSCEATTSPRLPAPPRAHAPGRRARRAGAARRAPDVVAEAAGRRGRSGPCSAASTPTPSRSRPSSASSAAGSARDGTATTTTSTSSRSSSADGRSAYRVRQLDAGQIALVAAVAQRLPLPARRCGSRAARTRHLEQAARRPPYPSFPRRHDRGARTGGMPPEPLPLKLHAGPHPRRDLLRGDVRRLAPSTGEGT